MTGKNRHRRIIIGAVTSVMMPVVVAVCGSASTTSAASPHRAPSVASTAQVLQAVAAAPSVKTVPSDLTPPLQDFASSSVPAAVAPDAMLDGDGCNPGQAATTTGSCVFGDPKGSKTIVLYGDSHAGMWWSGFNAVAKGAHWKLVLLMKAACPSVDLSFWYWPTNSAYSKCRTWHSTRRTASTR